MQQLFCEGLQGFLIFAQDQREHDIRLSNTLKRLQDAGVTLNAEKCAFSQTSIRFLGHIIDEHGIHADPEKTSAILKMETPTTITGSWEWLISWANFRHASLKSVNLWELV